KDRDPNIAEAFLDPAVSLSYHKDEGQVVTFTSSEAVNAGIADAEVRTQDDVFNQLQISAPNVMEHQLTWVDKVIALLINPMVSGLLIMGIIGGIYFELQTPGIGFALVVAVISAALFFAPLYLQGLADHWEI